MSTPFLIHAARWSCRAGEAEAAAALRDVHTYEVDAPVGRFVLDRLTASVRGSEPLLTRDILVAAYITVAINGHQARMGGLVEVAEAGGVCIEELLGGDDLLRPSRLTPGHDMSSMLWARPRFEGGDSLTTLLEFFEFPSSYGMRLMERLGWRLIDAQLRGEDDWGVDFDVYLSCIKEG